jgi:hypothetical protein
MIPSETLPEQGEARPTPQPKAEPAAATSEPKAKSVKVRKPRRPGAVGAFLANVITTGVGLTAGFVSWGHLFELGQDHGAKQDSAFLTPFTIDGMIVVGTLKLRQARLEGKPAHWAAYLAVILGVAGTIAGNIAAAPNDMTARALYAAPPTAFLVVVEVMFGRPLTMNLWDLIKMLWSKRHRRARPAGTPEPARTTEQRRAPRPVPEKTPEKAPQKAVEPRTPRVVPTVPTGPAPGATRKPGRQAKPPELVTGSRSRPARMVDGKILTGDDLKADARAKIAARLAGGAERDGLGAWVARTYDPALSERWGQERVAEVPDPTLLDATGQGRIDAEVPLEKAVPLDDVSRYAPASA